MTPLSPEATNVLYGDGSGLPLAEQLKAAYDRNLADGSIVPPTITESLGSVVTQVVAEAPPVDPSDTGFNPGALTERQRLAAESILDQFESSYQGTVDTIDALNDTSHDFNHNALTAAERIDTPSEPEVRELLETTLMNWVDRGILDYVADKLEADPEAFTLVATPSLTETQWSSDNPETRLQNGFKMFAQEQPNATTTYIYDNYCQGYSRQDMCGEPTAAQGISFSLVPTEYSNELIPAAAVGDQRLALENIQTDNPDLGYHVDSPLAQLTRLFTLRAAGLPLKDFAPTFARNFDLEVRNGIVPFSGVSDDGVVSASRHVAGTRSGARVAVG